MEENRAVLKLGRRSLQRTVTRTRFSVCCPLLASCVHCNLSSARSALLVPFSLFLSSFLSLPVHEGIHSARCGRFLCDGQQRVSTGLRGTRPREGTWPWGSTVLTLSCLQHSQAAASQRLGVSIRTSFTLSEKGWNVSSWQHMIVRSRASPMVRDCQPRRHGMWTFAYMRPSLTGPHGTLPGTCGF